MISDKAGRNNRTPFAAITQQAIRSIFENDELIAAGEFGDLLPLRARTRGACRVLKVRNDVEEFRHAFFQCGLERIDVRTIAFEWDACYFRAMSSKREDAAIVRGRFRADGIPRLQHFTAKEFDEFQ